MINPDELDPQKPKQKPIELDTLSVEELQDYIQRLEVEIARVERTIAKKNAHKDSLQALFGGPSSEE